MYQKILFQLFACMIVLNSFSQELRTISWGGLSTPLHNDSLVSLLNFEESIYNHSFSNNKIYL